MKALAFLLSGMASWYSLPGNHMADGAVFVPTRHYCAMRRPWPLEMRISIVNRDTGQHSWCVVRDRGPALSTGRSLDVSPVVRDELGFGAHGVIRVAIYRAFMVMRRCTSGPIPLTCITPPPAPCVLRLVRPKLSPCR